MAAKFRIFVIFTLLAAVSFAAPRLAAPETPSPRTGTRPASSRPTPTPAPPQKLPDGVAPPAYKPGAMPFHDGERLTYVASWIGIPAATARIELVKDRKDASLWLAQASVQTNQFADLLFKMRDYLNERIRQDTFAPQKMYIRQSENKRLNDFNVTFDRRAELVTMVKSNRKGKQIKQFISSDPWGPLSGTIMALSQPLQVGERYSFDVFTGSTRYVFDFRVVRREKITTPMGTFDALRLVPGVLYESNGKLTESATGTTIWVTADRRHLPLRVEAQAFIGTVRADLIEVSG